MPEAKQDKRLLTDKDIQDILGFEIPKNAKITSITLNREQLYAILQAQVEALKQGKPPWEMPEC